MIIYKNKKFSEYPKTIIDIPEEKSWTINSSVNSIGLTKDEGKTLAIEENPNPKVTRYLALPFHRFCSNYYIILLKNKSYTIKELLGVIYTFYNEKKLSYQDLKSLDCDDVFEYIDKRCLQLKENPELIINPINIMGDRRFFEGIYVETDNIGDIQYTLHLGS